MAMKYDDPFSEDLRYWLNNYSQSAAVDMGEGGDDAMSVAEITLTCIDLEPELREEWDRLMDEHGHEKCLKWAAQHVCTL